MDFQVFENALSGTFGGSSTKMWLKYLLFHIHLNDPVKVESIFDRARRELSPIASLPLVTLYITHLTTTPDSEQKIDALYREIIKHSDPMFDVIKREYDDWTRYNQLRKK